MVAKSVSDLLNELDHPLEGIAPSIIFEHMTKKGYSTWGETSDIDRNLFAQFIALKEIEAATNKVEYAYFFWGRIRKRLQTNKPPIGEEHE